MQLIQRPIPGIPSYATGFASPDHMPAANPELHNALVLNWHGPLGVTGIGTNSIKDTSGRGNHSTPQNMNSATDWPMTKMGWALDFDGSNDYVTTGRTAVSGQTLMCEAGNAFTVGIWALNRGDGTMVGKGVLLQTDRIFQIFKQAGINNNPAFRIRGALKSFDLIALNVWYFHAVTWDGSTARYYLDGTFIDVLNVGAAADDPGQDIVFGARSNGTGFFLDGQISSVFIASKAWTPNEIQALFRDQHAIPRPLQRTFVGTTGGAPPAGATVHPLRSRLLHGTLCGKL